MVHWAVCDRVVQRNRPRRITLRPHHLHNCRRKRLHKHRHAVRPQSSWAKAVACAQWFGDTNQRHQQPVHRPHMAPTATAVVAVVCIRHHHPRRSIHTASNNSNRPLLCHRSHNSHITHHSHQCSRRHRHPRAPLRPRIRLDRRRKITKRPRNYCSHWVRRAYRMCVRGHTNFARRMRSIWSGCGRAITRSCRLDRYMRST